MRKVLPIVIDNCYHEFVAHSIDDIDYNMDGMYCQHCKSRHISSFFPEEVDQLIALYLEVEYELQHLPIGRI